MFFDNPAEVATDRIRLMIGDTDNNELDLSNNTINYYLTTAKGNETKTALLCINALLVKYARYDNEVVGEVEVDYRRRYENYLSLKKQLEVGSIGFFYAGGIDKPECTIANGIDNGWTQRYKGICTATRCYEVDNECDC